MRSACTVPHIVPMSFGRHTWAGVLMLSQGFSELLARPDTAPRHLKFMGVVRTER